MQPITRKNVNLCKSLKALIPPLASLACLSVFTCTLGSPAFADDPGRGLTAHFEINFMEMTIDHHFSALRMTELAAGTDLQREASISPSEGTAPTPGFAATAAKATLDDIKSLARRNNRMQREEIVTLQSYLKQWYGIDYQPRIRSDAQTLINILESAPAGNDFNHAFLETFSRHHFSLFQPLNGCLTGSDLEHYDLRRSCNDMWHSQTSDIDEMRHDLARHFHIFDYQPFSDEQPLNVPTDAPRGQHSGPRP